MPEYLGKKSTARDEIHTLYALASRSPYCASTGLGRGDKSGARRVGHKHRTHGFTETLYAYTSCFANNGQNSQA